MPTFTFTTLATRLAMAKEFEGDEEDVKIRLLTSVPGALTTTIRARSEILRSRSVFFEVRLSERWSTSNTCSGQEGVRPVDLDVTVVNDAASGTYLRCINLMAVPSESLLRALCRTLRGVRDALELLHVAGELIFTDCVHACLQYLAMLPSCTNSELASIKEVVKNLYGGPYREPPDIKARIGPHLTILPWESLLLKRRFLVRVLHEAHKSIEKTPLKALDPSQPIPESEILRVWNGNLELVKKQVELRKPDSKAVVRAASALPWMLSQLLALQVADCVVDTFAKENGLPTLLLQKLSARMPSRGISSSYSGMYSVNSCSDRESSFDLDSVIERMVFLLSTVADALCRGRVLLTHKSRISLIEAWLPVVTLACSFEHSHLLVLLKELIDGFPHADRDRLSEVFSKHSLGDFDSSISGWCGTLLRSSLCSAEETDLCTALQLTKLAGIDIDSPMVFPMPTKIDSPVAVPILE